MEIEYQIEYHIDINFIQYNCPYLIDIPGAKFLRWYLVKSIDYDEDKLYDVLTLVDSDGRFIKVTAVDIYENRARFIESHEKNEMSILLGPCLIKRNWHLPY